MHWLWNKVEKMVVGKLFKPKLFLLLNTLFFALVGLLLWAAAWQFFQVGWSWGICLVGYPAFFGGYIGGLFYLLNHQ